MLPCTSYDAVMTPNEKLANEVLDALLRARLISEGKRNEFLSKLAMGTISQDDWILYIKPVEESKGGNGDV